MQLRQIQNTLWEHINSVKSFRSMLKVSDQKSTRRQGTSSPALIGECCRAMKAVTEFSSHSCCSLAPRNRRAKKPPTKVECMFDVKFNFNLEQIFFWKFSLKKLICLLATSNCHTLYLANNTPRALYKWVQMEIHFPRSSWWWYFYEV